MKIAFLLLVFIPQYSFAQFNGKLVYQVDKPTSRLVMTYYQNGTAGHMEAYTIHLNSGATDTTTVQPQDTLLWDFSKGYETHLAFHAGIAVMMAYALKASIAARMGSGLQGSLTVASKGADTANGYNCTHYVITSTSKLGTSTRDLWVTGDLGPAPSAWVVGPYTYFTPGYPHFVKLQAAGANGVVVKAVFSYTGQGVQGVMNLTHADTNTPNVYFTPPSWYVVNDQTGMTSLPANLKN